MFNLRGIFSILTIASLALFALGLDSYSVSAQGADDFKSLSMNTLRTELFSSDEEDRGLTPQVLKKVAEKRKIIEKRKTFELTADFCDHLDYYDNYLNCQQYLQDQQAACEQQVTSGNNIYIDIGNQLIFGVKDCKLVLYSRMISGKNSTPTPVGSYKIYEKRGPHWMQGQWYVTKALYYYGGYAIHDARWRVGRYWNKDARAYSGSHGCTNVPDYTIQTLWDNFSIGDNVHAYWQLPENVASELWAKVGGSEPVMPER